CHRPNAWTGVLHPRSDDTCRGRPDPGGAHRADHGPWTRLRVELEGAAMAADLRVGFSGDRDGLLLRTRCGTGLDLDHSWVDSCDRSVALDLARPQVVPGTLWQLRSLWRHRQRDGPDAVV